MKLELVKETKATGEVFYYVAEDGKFLLHTMNTTYERTKKCFDKLKNENLTKIETLETYES